MGFKNEQDLLKLHPLIECCLGNSENGSPRVLKLPSSKKHCSTLILILGSTEDIFSCKLHWLANNASHISRKCSFVNVSIGFIEAPIPACFQFATFLLQFNESFSTIVLTIVNILN